LTSLGFDLTSPTSLLFLRRWSKVAQSNLQIHNLCKYLIESALVHHSTLMFSPSLLSASALYLARRMLKVPNFWTPTLAYYTEYSEEDVLTCATTLNNMLKQQGHGETKDLKSVFRKYASKKVQSVSSLPALENF